MSLGVFLGIVLLAFILAAGLEPCVWNLFPHRWEKRRNVDICSRCGLIRKKVRK